MTVRDIIAAEVERLVDMLDRIDGDPDFEIEIDIGGDEPGEPEGHSWHQPGERAA
jgi:hypothetical protein